jgi:hypothetical protein
MSQGLQGYDGPIRAMRPFAQKQKPEGEYSVAEGKWLLGSRDFLAFGDPLLGRRSTLGEQSNALKQVHGTVEL